MLGRCEHFENFLRIFYELIYNLIKSMPNNGTVTLEVNPAVNIVYGTPPTVEADRMSHPVLSSDITLELIVGQVTSKQFKCSEIKRKSRGKTFSLMVDFVSTAVPSRDCRELVWIIGRVWGETWRSSSKYIFNVTSGSYPFNYCNVIPFQKDDYLVGACRICGALGLSEMFKINFWSGLGSSSRCAFCKQRITSVRNNATVVM